MLCAVLYNSILRKIIGIRLSVCVYRCERIGNASVCKGKPEEHLLRTLLWASIKTPKKLQLDSLKRSNTTRNQSTYKFADN